MMRRFIFLLPLVVLLILLFGADDLGTEVGEDIEGRPGDRAEILEPQGRLVVLIIDSLRMATLEAEGVMPHLLELARDERSLLVPVTTCAANFTYPCLQTLFEGRQSPFVAGLHNFTGRASQADSLLAALLREGRSLAVASNISLVSLYGRHATHILNVEDWPISHLERDLKTFDVVAEWLEGDEVDDLFIHLLGTDKAAHHDLPGTPAYEEHFRLVDARSAELIESLDLSRDHLVITGDHGHDEAGHHTRDSIAILAGPRFETLFDLMTPPEGLDQTELLYFMSIALGMELPLHYEGRHFLSETDVDLADNALAQAFVEQSRDVLLRAGFEGDDFQQVIAAHRSQREGQHKRSLYFYLPLLMAFFLWLVVIEAHLAGRVDLRRPWLLHLVLAISCLMTWKLTSTTVPGSFLWSAIYLLAAIFWVRRFGGLRHLLWMAALLTATAAIALHVREWADFFHTRGGFVPAQPVFYGLLPLVGLAVAWLRDADWTRAPEGAMAFCLFCLPSGVYYYQFGQNMFWGFLLAGAAVVLVALMLRFRAGRGVPGTLFRGKFLISLAMMLTAIVLLLMQEAGGWEWSYFPADWLRSIGEVPAVFLYGGLVVYLAWLMKTWRRRAILAAYMIGALAFSVGVGALSIFDFVASHSVVLFVASWLMVRRAVVKPLAADESPRCFGLVLFGAGMAMTWFLVGGFFIHNVDFHFAFEYFGHLQQDRYIFALVFSATLLKYGLPLASILLVFRLLKGPAAFGQAIDWMLYFFAFMLLALFTQIFFAAVGSTEKLYELAVVQVVFTFTLFVITVLFSSVVTLIDHIQKNTI